MMKRMSTRRGFVLLLAVLISSILVALGGAIFDIVSKEVTLSSAGRESQFAFYAADTGIECALYWDHEGAFASTSPTTQVSCGGTSVPVTVIPDTPTDNYTYTANFTFGYAADATHNVSTDVTVTRVYAPVEQTTVVSAGHNTSVMTDPLRLERAIQITY